MSGRGSFALLLLIVVAAAGSFAVACGSGSSSKGTPTAARTVAATPASTASGASVTPAAGGVPTISVAGTAGPTITPSPVSDAQKTALALGASVGFTDFKDPSGRYVVGYPDGWTIQSTAQGSSATLAGTPVTAQLGVFCVNGGTADGLIQADRSFFAQNHLGTIPTDNPVPTKVAGVDAKEIVWQGAYLDTVQKHWFIYMESHGCAWRLLLTTLPGADENAMQQVFQKMLASFRFS